MTRLAAALIVPAFVLVLAGCVSGGSPAGPEDDTTSITSVTFEQYQSIPDFDDSQYVQTDPNAELQQLFDEYDVVPGTTDTAAEELCDGGLSTTLELEYANGDRAEMHIESCGESEYTEFNEAASDLFTQWREALS